MNRPVPRHRAEPVRPRSHRGPRPPRSKKRLMRSMALLGGAGIASMLSVVAFAVWSTTGAGVAQADTSTLGAASSVTASASISTVTLSWTSAVPPSGASLTGYYVTRWAGSTPADACGTTPSVVGSYVSGAATGCSDTSVPNGTYTYSVTAVFATWTAESLSSNAIVVNVDGTAPTLSLGSSGRHQRLPVRVDALLPPDRRRQRPVRSDRERRPVGAGVRDVPGDRHGRVDARAETVTTGTGAAPSITYTSSPFSWTASPTQPSTTNLVGTDAHGNNSSIPISFAADVTAPTAGALTVNGVVATGGGLPEPQQDRCLRLGPHVDYTADIGSGVASSVLTRQARPYRRCLRGVRRRDGARGGTGSERPRHGLLPVHPDRDRPGGERRRGQQHGAGGPGGAHADVLVGLARGGVRSAARASTSGGPRPAPSSVAAAVTDAEVRACLGDVPGHRDSRLGAQSRDRLGRHGDRTDGDLHVDAVLLVGRPERAREQELRRRPTSPGTR